MVFVIVACVIFVAMYLAKICVDKAVQGIECPAHFPKNGTNFKAQERVNTNVRRLKQKI
jgi:hypothetical protein